MWYEKACDLLFQLSSSLRYQSSAQYDKLFSAHEFLIVYYSLTGVGVTHEDLGGKVNKKNLLEKAF
jgi:hypothetical protein